jgi:beta-phosphoglucomutase
MLYLNAPAPPPLPQPRPLPKRFRVRAFIFDMDGVLVDSTRLHTECWQIYLQRHGITAEYLEERMLGKRNDELVPLLFGPGLSQEEIAAHGARKEALYRERLAPRFADYLVPGVLEFLGAWPHLPKAVATNAEPANVALVIERAGWHDRFQAVVDGHQVERPKPAPDIYLRAAALLDVPIRDCVVFEDSPDGIRAARDAGARVVGLATTITDIAEIKGVDVAIRNFQDPALESWLRSLQNGH